MTAPADERPVLQTEAGAVPLQAYHLRLAGHAWSILHTGAILASADEAHFLRELRDHLPYGVALWPAAIALAHELVARAASLHGRRILELGAGAGLPGIVAASLGGQVVQTDRDPLVLSLCQRNGARNAARGITYRQADWSAWTDTGRYDWIIGADILYDENLHPHLRQIFETNLAPGGSVLLADPFRAVSLRLLEALEAAGWTVTFSTWRVGEGTPLRALGLFDLAPPH